MSEEKILLSFHSLEFRNPKSGSYLLLLADKNGKRRLPIVIGAFEAQSIAIHFENIVSERPLTHELFKIIFDEFEIIVEEVVIDKLIEGIFHAKIITRYKNHHYQLDARPSDAIALALRFNVNIYVLKTVINEAGIVMDEENFPQNKKQINENVRQNNLEKNSIETLNEMLNVAIEKEDYETAAKIRDEINKRN